MRFLKHKIDQGAEYIITQLFYDNAYYFDFVKKCRAEGINVPIIPGIKTITSSRQLSIIPHFFHVTVPKELSTQIENAKTVSQVKQEGIKWTIKQCQELMEFGVPALHFYTMGKAESVKIITNEIF